MAFRPDGTLIAWRIADSRYPLFDGSGAARYGARWNSAGRRVIYAAETYAGALLEVLVHSGAGRIPRTQAFIEITIPRGVSIEETAGPRGWDSAGAQASRAFGDAWYDSRRSCVLLVPSIVTRIERNVVINQDHPEFAKIRASRPRPVRWDERLFDQR
jgi:RES domain-containing protein